MHGYQHAEDQTLHYYRHYYEQKHQASGKKSTWKGLFMPLFRPFSRHAVSVLYMIQDFVKETWSVHSSSLLELEQPNCSWIELLPVSIIPSIHRWIQVMCWRVIHVWTFMHLAQTQTRQLIPRVGTTKLQAYRALSKRYWCRYWWLVCDIRCESDAGLNVQTCDTKPKPDSWYLELEQPNCRHTEL